jgi:peptide/nickel transport system substrate-binding protein
VFRLRPGIRFSNGRRLTPADVRASVARLVTVMSGFGEKEYLPIRGAGRCSAKRCDLSKGIETDAVAETLTIHLARPDAEFLNKLANALVVPAGSPLELPTEPLPGTGPYTTQRWDPKRGGVLVRNPHFGVWSPDRPDGFADEIAMRLETPAMQVVAVDRGTADVALFRYGVEEVAPTRARFGSHFHSDGAAQTWFLFLNTRVPPFDDARARRALNYAVDRGRIAEILGSSVTHKPTCQLLPPGSPGYTPSCRFSLGSSPAGVWTAPDLDKARRLVADSGTRGMKVEFWGSQPWEPLSDYFRTVLRRLGYRSSARTFDDLHLIMETASRPRSPRPQVGLWGWLADSAGPLNFLSPLVSCAGSVNLSRFCDRNIEAAMQQAAAARGPDAIEQWRAVEAALAEQSPTVPLVNENALSLTGKRVGNYQYHPISGPLLDQMWVK